MAMPPDSSFRSRLREALQQSAVRRGEQNAEPEAERPAPGIRYEPEEDSRERANEVQAAWIAEVLGGAWQHDGRGACLVIDRVYPADRPHGNAEIGAYAEALERYQQALHAFDASTGADVDSTGSLFSERPESPAAGLPDCRRQFLFFDLETTGLSGGAGICAFLIGYGWFEGHDFRTRQYFLGGYGHEAAMLRLASRPLDEGRTLGSFNGKTFDVPLIHGRYLFHRVASPFDEVAHIDLLHPARRLWRYRPKTPAARGRDGHDGFGSYFRSAALRQQYRAATAASGALRRIDLSDSAASCALGVLEEAILGFNRRDDVPGAEIPSRYFHYARTGDARTLAPVLEHNRLDLVSLAAVASVIARMLHEGADATRNAHECLALGRLYERSGAGDRAADCFERAVAGTGSAPWSGDVIVQREALRHLAVRYRRERRWDQAAASWQQLLELLQASDHARHDEAELEALVALAVHHEHRSKDLRAAHALVVRALNSATSTHERESLAHRLARLERKLGGCRIGPPGARPRS
ncbi:MAG: ribonuclease H-like domain-containing protein [Bacteroidales bacterium]